MTGTSTIEPGAGNTPIEGAGTDTGRNAASEIGAGGFGSMPAAPLAASTKVPATRSVAVAISRERNARAGKGLGVGETPLNGRRPHLADTMPSLTHRVSGAGQSRVVTWQGSCDKVRDPGRNRGGEGSDGMILRVLRARVIAGEEARLAQFVRDDAV